MQTATQTLTLSGFLEAVFPDPTEAIYLRGLSPKGHNLQAHNLTTTRNALIDDHVFQQQLLTLNKTHGLYVVVNKGGHSDADITGYTAFFCENDTLSIAEQHARLDACPIPPSIRIETKKSVHAYWPIDGDCTEAEWREVQARLIDYFDADPTIKNPSRVMRLPFFDHISTDHSRKRVEVHTFETGRRYHVAEMLQAFPAVIPQPQTKKQSQSKSQSQQTGGYANWDALRAALGRAIENHPTAKQNKSGNIDCQGVCHGGKGRTGLFYDPCNNQAYCNKGCDQEAMLRAFGLPLHPEKQDGLMKGLDQQPGLSFDLHAAERGKVKVTARYDGKVTHVDILPLADAAKREAFVKALSLNDDDAKAAREQLLELSANWVQVDSSAADKPEKPSKSVTFAETSDGRLIEQIASGFAVYDGKEVSYDRQVETPDLIYQPFVDSFLTTGGLALPEKLIEYGDEAELEQCIDAHIYRHLDLKERDRKLCVAYVKLTYLYDKLLELPYLRPIGPKGNGKSRFISTVGGICYRPVTLINPSAASAFRIVDRYHPTLIIDEANFDESGDDTKALMQILNAGYQRVAKVPRVAGNNSGQFEIELFDVYGPKLIASLTRMESAAFESRCIQIEMEKTRRTDIRFRLSAQLLEEQADLRAKLTLWRLRHWQDDMEQRLDEAEAELKKHDIEPRYVQVSIPLFALLDGATLKNEFIKMVRGRNTDDQEARRDTLEGQLMGIIHSRLFPEIKTPEIKTEDEDEMVFAPDLLSELKESAPCELLTIGSFLDEVNKGLPDAKKHDVRWLGKQFRKFGFQTREINTRTSENWKKSALVFNRETFAKMFNLYSFPVPLSFSSGQSGQSDNYQQEQLDSLTGSSLRGIKGDFSSGQANYNGNQQVTDLTGLTGSKSTEMAGEIQSEADSPAASVSFMITKAQERELLTWGYSQQEIDRMKPAEAHTILADGTRKASLKSQKARAKL